MAAEPSYTLSSYGPTTASVVSPHATDEMVRVTVERISERCGRPGMAPTDAWVRVKVPHAGDAAGLYVLVRRTLDGILQDNFDSDLAEQALDELGSRVVQEIPQSAFRQEETMLWGELERTCASWGGDVDELLHDVGKTRDDLQNAFKAESEFQVRGHIGLDALAEHMGITISGEEEMRIAAPPNEEPDEDETPAQLKRLCLRRKALRCACASAHLVFREPSRTERRRLAESACDSILGKEAPQAGSSPRLKLMRGGKQPRPQPRQKE